MTYLLTYILLYCVLDAWHDSIVIKGKDFHAVKAGIFCLNIAMVVFLLHKQLFHLNWLFMAEMAFVFLTLRWILFDIFVNLFLGRTALQSGHTAFIDKLFPGLWALFVKCLFLGVSVLIIIQMYLQ